MGSFFSSAQNGFQKKLSDGMEKNAANMQQKQKEVMLKQREVQLAMILAQQKDLFNWFASFYGTVAILGVAKTVKSRSPTALIPLLPLSFILGFQWDLVYGTKLERNRKEAERILQEERHALRFVPPEGNLLIDTKQYEQMFKGED